MSEWKEHTRNGKTRLVYQTATHTATIWQRTTPPPASVTTKVWLWAVYGGRIGIYGKCYDLASAKCAALIETIARSSLVLEKEIEEAEARLRALKSRRR